MALAISLPTGIKGLIDHLNTLLSSHRLAEFAKLVTHGQAQNYLSGVGLLGHRLGHEEYRQLNILRYYDFMVGVDKDIRVNSPIEIYPIDLREHVVHKDIHLHLVYNSIKLALHTIPSICFGKWDNNASISVIFLGLKRSTALMDDYIVDFYNKGFYPAMKILMGKEVDDWPVGYNAKSFRCQAFAGETARWKKVLPESLVPVLGDVIRHQLALNEVLWGDRLLFLHQIRDVKSSTAHVLGNTEDSEIVARDSFRTFLQTHHIDLHGLQRDSWWINVGLEISSPKRHLAWLTSGHTFLFQRLLRTSNSQTDGMFHPQSKHYEKNITLGLSSLSGCRILPDRPARGHYEAQSLHLYLTNQSITAKHDVDFTLDRLELYSDFPAFNDSYHSYLQYLRGVCPPSAESLRSLARVEVCLPLVHASRPLLNFDELLAGESLASFDHETWWGLRAYNMLGVKLTFDGH